MTEALTARDDGRMGATMEVVAGWLGTVVHRLGTGDVAELRRLDPDDPSAAVFWRLVAAMPDDGNGAPWQAERERRFAVILRTFAELRDVHRSGRRLGAVLAEAGLDERRLLQLLRSRRTALAHAIRTTCHFLASKGATADAMGLARLVLSEDEPWEDDERRRLARDYFRAAARTERQTQGESR
jgi:hypothetical protein